VASALLVEREALMALAVRAALFAVALVSSLCGCGGETQRAVQFTGESTGDSRDWVDWGTGGYYAFATTAEEKESLLVYAWDGASIRKHTEVNVHQDNPLQALWLSDGKVLTNPVGKNTDFLLRRDAKTGRLLGKWLFPRGWYCGLLGHSHNGKYLVLLFREDVAYPPQGFDWERRRTRLALIDVATDRLDWIVDLIGDRDMIRGAVSSGDGAYIAVAGWDNGAAVVDVKQKKVLWEKRPPGEFGSTKVSISPRNGVIYVGGNRGRVYGMQIRSGKNVSAWWASDSGNAEDAQRVTSICVSPDEKYVAAGTGPYGRTYLWSTETGRMIKAFGRGPGGVLIVMFSPDSRHLGAFQPGRVEVLKVPGSVGP
jgi:WD40 repeat protein